jgi:hypothetical protein
VKPTRKEAIDLYHLEAMDPDKVGADMKVYTKGLKMLAGLAQLCLNASLNAPHDPVELETDDEFVEAYRQYREKKAKVNVLYGPLRDFFQGRVDRRSSSRITFRAAALKCDKDD